MTNLTTLFCLPVRGRALQVEDVYTASTSTECDRITVMLVGDSSVGKTSIMRRVCHGPVDQVHIATIGVDFDKYTTTIDGRITKFQVWDTAGQERYATITPHYYRHAQVVLLVYDVTQLESFGHIAKWMDKVQTLCRDGTLVFIVGNKVDLEHLRIVSQPQAIAMVGNYANVQYAECSGKTGKGVEELFMLIARLRCLQGAEDDNGYGESIKLHRNNASHDEKVATTKRICCTS